jgi:hypothetical protein
MFTKEEREIFEFDTGQGVRKVDPLALRRALVRAAQGDLYELSVRAAAVPEPTDKGAILAHEAAQEELLGVIRQGFGLPGIDPDTGEGITERMCWRIWNTWQEWLKGEPSGDGNSATGPAPTAGQAPVP